MEPSRNHEFIVYVGREGKETRRALDVNWKLN